MNVNLADLCVAKKELTAEVRSKTLSSIQDIYSVIRNAPPSDARLITIVKKITMLVLIMRCLRPHYDVRKKSLTYSS